MVSMEQFSRPLILLLVINVLAPIAVAQDASSTAAEAAPPATVTADAGETAGAADVAEEATSEEPAAPDEAATSAPALETEEEAEPTVPVRSNLVEGKVAKSMKETEMRARNVVRTDTPRATISTFIEAMVDYRKALNWSEGPDRDRMIRRIGDAVRTLNLSETPAVSREQIGRDTAIWLKEFLDRRWIVDYSQFPDKEDIGKDWFQIPYTELKLTRISEGDRIGEWLFSPDSVARAEHFYEITKNQPYLEGLNMAGAGYEDPWIERVMDAYNLQWAKNEFADMAIWQWIGLFIAILLGLTMRFVVSLLGGLVKTLASRTKTEWDEKLVESTRNPLALLAAVGLWFGCFNLLRLQGVPLSVLLTILQLVLSFALIWFFYRLVDVLSQFLKEKTLGDRSTLDDQLIILITRSLKVFVILFGALVAAQNLGLNVVSLLAGLGIGGLAFALAAKDSLANFFGSIMIMIDKPFKVGHWIKVAGAEGTVEDIGFRSTRIRTFYNSLISVPNDDVATGAIDNMGMRQYRRVYETIGVTYDTPPQKLEAFLEGIKNIIKANDHTRKDYFHVVFSGFGDSSLNIMLYFFLRVPTWNDELVEKQNIFIEIMRLAKSLEVDFAYPTQSLHIETFPEKQGVRQPHNVEQDWLKGEAAAFQKHGDKSQPDGYGIFVPPHRESFIRPSEKTSRGGDGEG